MSLSNLCFEQHEQDQAKLRKILLWALLGSVGVHTAALGLGQLSLWSAREEADLSPIEIIVTEPLDPAVETPELEPPDPTQPAELSTETNDPAPAPTASATSPRAAMVAAPRPAAIAEPAPPAAADPEQPPAETVTEAESELEVHEEEDTPQPDLPPEAMETDEIAEELDAEEPEEVIADLEADEANEAIAEPAESDRATADSSQLDRLRNFLRRQREAGGDVATDTPAPGNGTATAGPSNAAGPTNSDSAGTAETTAVRPVPGTSGTTNSSGSGNGQGQGSRTVACQNCVRPDYPQSALDAGAEGQPMVSVDINPDGSVRSVTLTRSSGNPAIDQAAIQAARNSRFQPVSGGASVPIEYDLTIEGSRRNRDARRRGERQAVELPPEPRPEAATAEPTPSSSPASRPVDTNAADPPAPPAASGSESPESPEAVDATPTPPAAPASQPEETNTPEPPAPAAASEPAPAESAPPAAPASPPPAAPPPAPAAPAPVAPPPSAPVAPPVAPEAPPATSSDE